jgi:hypothetical protein
VLGHQRVLKLGDRADDLEEQPAHRRGGVDALVEHDEIHAAVLEQLGELDQVLERATEPIELGDYQLVAGPVRAQQRLVELGPSRQLSRRLVDEDLVATDGCQRVALRFGMLIPRRDPPIADPHIRSVSRTPERVTLARTRQALHHEGQDHG